MYQQPLISALITEKISEVADISANISTFNSANSADKISNKSITIDGCGGKVVVVVPKDIIKD